MTRGRQGLRLSVALLVCGCGPSLPAAKNSDAETSSGESTSDEPSTSESPRDEDGTDGDGPLFAGIPDEPGYDECSMFEQDCPEGDKCVPYARYGGAWDAFKCVPVTGDQAPGDPCSWDGITEATDDCDENGACWDVMAVDGQLIGTCFAFCSPEHQCPAGSACAYLGQLAITFCFPQCDPIGQDCGAGLGCFWAENEFSCIFTTSDIPPGEPCGFVNDCVLGSGCLAAELFPVCAGESCCSPFCDINLGDAQCEAVPDTSCVAFFEPDNAAPGFEHVGVCVSS